MHTLRAASAASLAVLLTAASAAAAAPRIAVMPVVAGEGIAAPTATAVTDALAAEVRKRASADVVTLRDIASVLSLEQQRSMLGCPSDVCVAELGNALGAERIVASDLSKLGESFLFHLRLVDVGQVKVLAQADRRLRGGTVDDLLDALPALAGELFGAPGAAPQAPAAAAATPASKPASPAWVEEPLEVSAEERALLSVFTDGAGHYAALDYTAAPFDTWMGGPLFWGDARKLFRVRVQGGSASGDEQKLSRTFWDPRGRRGQGGSIDLAKGDASIDCRGSKPVPLKPVPVAEAQKLLKAVRFFAPPWRRIPLALARDDDGGYWYVDGARTAEGEPSGEEPDRQLRLGRKGSLVRVDLLEATADGGGELYVARSGRFKVARVKEETKAEWLTPGGSKPLSWLEPADHGRLIYLELGAYGPGLALGTPCDGR
jgi:hypothetical protein